ncbi:MAG: ATP-binding cassette domain-containing protein, partial [Burkholderiaceae bacterium]|nr:ATP-binding cassette domain-containing protein [Burkholderiaceae bacterium]
MEFDDPYDSSLLLAGAPRSTRPLLQVEGLGKRLADAASPVLRDCWFSARHGEAVCLLGRRGCGKTTLLRLLAGLETASEGAVVVDGRAPVGPGADRALVAAEHGLLRWMTLIDNIAFAVRGRWPGWTTTKVMAHSRHYAALFGLSRVEGKKPGQVAAAVKLRVALARAF